MPHHPVKRSHGNRSQRYSGPGGWPLPDNSGSSSDGGGAGDSQLISWVQSCLAGSIGSWVPQSGRLGRATRHAIRTFQSQQGLPVNGFPGRDTVAQLQQACGGRAGGESEEISSAPPAAGCNEDRCASGYIAWVQRSLNQLGAHLNVTGVLDRTTIQSINQFKQGHKISPREYYASPLIEQALVQAGAAPPPAVRRLRCGATDLKVLLPLLKRYAGDIPAEYLLGWITVESGAKLGDLTKICERGYFQVHPEESQDLKLDHDRLSTDPAYSVEGGIKLVRKYAAGIESLLRRPGAGEQADFFWALVKLRHWIPSAPVRILVQMRKQSVPVTDWSSVRSYVNATPNLGFGSFDPRAGITSVDHYLEAVARWRKLLANGTASRPQAGNGNIAPAATEPSAIQSAIQRGERDENRLTDTIFTARHPERRGQPLQQQDQPLIKEWLGIRDRLVRPALRALSNDHR
jgi:peptidoglycan hydrolase-like protein with peptidoglycan-binding domain